MLQERLEERVTDGGVIYLDDIERDLDRGRLVFRLLASEVKGRVLVPLFGRVVRILTFPCVENYAECWEEGKEWQRQDMYQIIGIVEKPEDGRTLYHVILDDFEIQFTSTVSPSVEDLSDGAA